MTPGCTLRTPLFSFPGSERTNVIVVSSHISPGMGALLPVKTEQDTHRSTKGQYASGRCQSDKHKVKCHISFSSKVGKK